MSEKGERRKKLRKEQKDASLKKLGRALQKVREVLELVEANPELEPEFERAVSDETLEQLEKELKKVEEWQRKRKSFRVVKGKTNKSKAAG